MDESTIKEEIWRTIQALNRTWTLDNNPDELKNYFHKDMVAITPTDQNRIEGGDKCIASWKKFSQNAKIHYFMEFDPKIQLFGDDRFTIVTYYYDMSFDMAGQTIKTKGRDMFALINENDRWWVVANQFSAFPKE